MPLWQRAQSEAMPRHERDASGSGAPPDPGTGNAAATGLLDRVPQVRFGGNGATRATVPSNVRYATNLCGLTEGLRDLCDLIDDLEQVIDDLL